MSLPISGAFRHRTTEFRKVLTYKCVRTSSEFGGAFYCRKFNRKLVANDYLTLVFYFTLQVLESTLSPLIFGARDTSSASEYHTDLLNCL
jgi:hypothetical protein